VAEGCGGIKVETGELAHPNPLPVWAMGLKFHCIS
jgi:hypothetical protein